MMKTLWQDLIYGSRLLAKRPGLSMATVVCLGLGIGVTTTIFSVVNGALLRPFPYEKPNRLAIVWEESPEDPLSASGKRISNPNFFDCRQSSRAFADMALIGGTVCTMRLPDASEPVRALEVTSNFLDLLGVRPALGRPFVPENDQKGRQQVVILTHACWRKWFHGTPNIVGKSVILRSFVAGEQSYSIVGVLPAEFTQPVYPMSKTDVLIPLDREQLQGHRSYRIYTAIGRLREGMSIEQAQAELDVTARRLAQEYPKENRGLRLVTKSLRAEFCGETSHVLYLLLGASALLLVVACGNVADLLLIEGLHRRREIAVRTALGAGRLRVLRQLAVEGLLLSLLGLPAGLLVSLWGLRVLRPLILAYVPIVGALRVDVAVLVFAAAAVVVTGVAFGLIPALQAWKTDLSVVLKGEAAHATAGRRTRRMHALLVAAQVALTFVLLVGAGLAVRTFRNLLRIDPGFNPRHVLTMELELPRDRYDYRHIGAFHDDLLAQVRRLPGVSAASTSSGLPLVDQGMGFIFYVEGEAAPPAEGYDSYSSWISTGYFRTLGVPVLAGRDFDEVDTHDNSRHVVIVNQTLAQRFGSVSNALGKRLHRHNGDDSYEIIAVAADECYRDDQLTGKLEISPRTYFPRYANGSVNLTVRAQADPLRLAPAVRGVLRALDNQLVIRYTRSMEDVFQDAFNLQRLTMLLVGIFAVLAFVLGVAGLYAVVAHSTRSRYGEIAIRMAVGARPADIRRMVLLHGVKVTALGMGVGLGVIVALARVAASYLYGVAPLDPLTLVGAVLLLGTTCFGACLLPARRAARTVPINALRYE